MVATRSNPLSVARIARSDSSNRLNEAKPALPAVSEEHDFKRHAHLGTIFTVTRNPAHSDLISKRYYNTMGMQPDKALLDALQNSASSSVHPQGGTNEEPEGERPSMIAACAVIHGRELYTARIGSGRVYLYREGHPLVMLNAEPDQEVAVEDADDTDWDETSALVHQSEGLQTAEFLSPFNINHWNKRLANGDQLLICTDQLYRYVNVQSIEAALACKNPKDACDSLAGLLINSVDTSDMTALVLQVHLNPIDELREEPTLPAETVQPLAAMEIDATPLNTDEQHRVQVDAQPGDNEQDVEHREPAVVSTEGVAEMNAEATLFGSQATKECLPQADSGERPELQVNTTELGRGELVVATREQDKTQPKDLVSQRQESEWLSGITGTLLTPESREIVDNDASGDSGQETSSSPPMTFEEAVPESQVDDLSVTLDEPAVPPTEFEDTRDENAVIDTQATAEHLEPTLTLPEDLSMSMVAEVEVGTTQPEVSDPLASNLDERERAVAQRENDVSLREESVKHREEEMTDREQAVTLQLAAVQTQAKLNETRQREIESKEKSLALLKASLEEKANARGQREEAVQTKEQQLHDQQNLQRQRAGESDLRTVPLPQTGHDVRSGQTHQYEPSRESGAVIDTRKQSETQVEISNASSMQTYEMTFDSKVSRSQFSVDRKLKSPKDSRSDIEIGFRIYPQSSLPEGYPKIMEVWLRLNTLYTSCLFIGKNNPTEFRNNPGRSIRVLPKTQGEPVQLILAGIDVEVRVVSIEFADNPRNQVSTPDLCFSYLQLRFSVVRLA